MAALGAIAALSVLERLNHIENVWLEGAVVAYFCFLKKWSTLHPLYGVKRKESNSSA